MKPDNAISRVVRPGLIIWFALLFSVLMLADGNYENFTVKEIYIKVFETVFSVMVGGYFVGKSYEHSVRISTDKKYRYKRGEEYKDDHDDW